MLPLISVIIPLYNSRNSLPDCLRSVIKQTHSNMEIILVDDGSEEEYNDIIALFNDNRVMYSKLEHSNANFARNYGIMKSRGEYIAMLDSDDLWLPNHLEECLNTVKREDADGLYGSLILKNTVNGNMMEHRVRALYDNETMMSYLLGTGYGAQTSSLFLSSESAKEIKWDESLKRHQDYDFVVRYSKSFKLKPKIKATTIYVATNKTKNIDFESCIRVIEENKNEIIPYIYNRYHQNMLVLAKRLNAEYPIIRHYERESIKYLEYIPYSQYILVAKPQTFHRKIINKVKYLYYILCAKNNY